MYDFIVVGGGTSGAALASTVADSPSRPKVLILEAGSQEHSHQEHRSIREGRDRGLLQPGLVRPYKTTNQAHLGGRDIQYPRGTSLGGSTNINFCVYSTPPKGDWDEWAERVQDETFGWEEARSYLKRLENYRSPSGTMRDFVVPDPEAHGEHGPLSVEFFPEANQQVKTTVESFLEYGFDLNPDVNSGNPIGVGIFPATTEKLSYRTTATSSFLAMIPPNLTVRTGLAVVKILIEGDRAVGVLLDNGEKVTASKDVIICAGAIDTPKLLMLSGIGDKEHLAAHDIKCIVDCLGVGANLQDHCRIPLEWIIDEEHGGLPPNALPDGEAGVDLLTFIAAWARDDELLHSAEAETLSAADKRHLCRETVPTAEIVVNLNAVLGTQHSLRFVVLGMVPQSKGSVRLASNKHKDELLIDPSYLSHSFDRANMCSLVRLAVDFKNKTQIGKHVVGAKCAPVGDGQDDIDNFINQNTTTVFHPSCTAKMGHSNDATAVVDGSFKVKGIDNLRVADMSVTPTMMNCHTQSVAYVIGLMAADKIISQHGLSKARGTG